MRVYIIEKIPYMKLVPETENHIDKNDGQNI